MRSNECPGELPRDMSFGAVTDSGPSKASGEMSLRCSTGSPSDLCLPDKPAFVGFTGKPSLSIGVQNLSAD